MNNTLYKFIPIKTEGELVRAFNPAELRQMPNAFLPPRTVLRLMSYETSKVRLKLHLFRLSYSGLILQITDRGLLCMCGPCGSSLLLVTTRPTETKSTKSKQRNATQ